MKVGIVGGGPAAIYAADILVKARPDTRVDLFEKLPVPFGLVRYGVAPDHPAITSITGALADVLDGGAITFYGNVQVGRDIELAELRRYYDAIIVATGADRARPLDLPGADKEGVFDSAEFVAWYDGHPYVPRDWPLDTPTVAVIGVGNVAADITRVLVKSPDALALTEIPENVEAGLRASAVRDVHVFGRRGPAQVKFSPLELRELERTAGVRVTVDPEDLQYDDASRLILENNHQSRQVVDRLVEWASEDPWDPEAEHDEADARHVGIHLLHRPVEILGGEHVEGVRFERTRLDGNGGAEGTGEFVDVPADAVYNATGYVSDPLPGLPFDEERLVIPSEAGRIEGATGIYVTGWVKRGPVGLIGSTKSDAKETITSLLEDADAGLLPEAELREASVIDALKERGVPVTDWDGWRRVDERERELGGAKGRARTKIVNAEELTDIARSR